MSALDIKAKPKVDAKAKVESKPIVENKPGVETKGKSRKLLWLAMFAVFIIIVGGAAFFAAPYLKGKTGKSPKKPEPEQVKATLALDPFLVNLADKEEIRFVKTTFQLGLAKEPSEEAKSGAAIAAIRDSIISLLSSKTAEQILTTQGKDKLREEIRSRIRSVAPNINILEVYIVDFVVQL
jgi:flagellar protein FliL